MCAVYFNGNGLVRSARRAPVSAARAIFGERIMPVHSGKMVASPLMMFLSDRSSQNALPVQ